MAGSLFNVLLASLSIAAVTAFSTDGMCAGGIREGSQTEMSSFLYECRNGQLVPKGCVTPDNGRVDLGGTYDVRQIRWQCVVDNDGYPKRVHKACVENGREYRENEKWDDGKVVYTCDRDREYLSVQPAGCIGEGNRKMNLGEKVTIRDLVYECRLNRDAVPTVTPWGCADKSGRQYNTGEQFEIGDFWFYCMNKDGKIMPDRVGCVHENMRMKHGDRFFKDDVIYECNVTETNAEIRVAGCVTRTASSGVLAERRVGCSWNEGTEPYQYTFQCKPDPVAKTAAKTGVSCNFVVPDGRGTYTIGIGCYRVIGKTGMACVQGSSPGDLKFIPLSVDENLQIRNPPPGTRYC